MSETFGLWFGGSHLGYGTHMATLAAAVLKTPGPIVEFGVGFYSTPLLHAFADEMQRDVVSLEHDPAWAAQFQGIETPRHKLIVVPEWYRVEAIYEGRRWGAAFVDHGPETRRFTEIAKLRPWADLVVVHDWNDEMYRNVADAYRYKWVSAHGTATAVLSDVMPFVLA